MKQEKLFLKEAMDRSVLTFQDNAMAEMDKYISSRFGDAVSFNTLTTNNVGLPSPALTNVMSKAVSVILGQMNADLTIGPKEKVMDWAQEVATYPIIETTGEVSDYSDIATPTFNGINTNFEYIHQKRIMANVLIGDLEAEQYGMAKIDYVSRKFNGAAENIKRQLDNIAYNGALDVNGTPIVYGIFNHPSLNAYESITTSWDSATFDQIKADIVNLLTILNKQTGGNVDVNNDRIIMAMPSTTLARIRGLATQYVGQTLVDQLKTSYPNLELVGDNMLSNASNNQNVLVIRALNDVGGVYDPCTQGYSDLMRMSRVVQNHNNYTQTMNAGGCGCIVYKPTFIVRARGV